MKTKCLFLDRDGVVNYDYGYVHERTNFDFVEGIFDLVKRANELSYLVIIVTNQAGIGHGYYSEEDFYSLSNWMIEAFNFQGCRINDVYFCPYHPSAALPKYRRFSADRKPEPGMIMTAMSKYNIDAKQSVLIGDKQTDIQAGSSAGIKSLYLLKTTLDAEKSSRHYESQAKTIHSLEEVDLSNTRLHR